MKVKSSLAFVATLWGSWVAIGDPAGTNVLADLRGKYEAMLEGSFAKYDNKILTMPDEYVKLLDAVEQRATKDGDLTGVMAIREEKARALADKSVPDATTDAAAVPAVQGARRKAREQLSQLREARSRDVLQLFNSYTNRLNSIEKQFTKGGKIEEAVDVRNERERVRNTPEVQAAMFDLDLSLASADGRKGLAGKKADRDPALLDSVRIPFFEYKGWDVNDPAGLVNRYIEAVYPQGLRIRLLSDRLRVRSVSYDRGMPRYSIDSIGRTYSAAESWTRVLTNETARAVLRVICSTLNVAYRADAESSGVVICDNPAGAASARVDGVRNEAVPVIGKPDVGDILDSFRVPAFSYSDWDIESPANVINRFVEMVAPRGIKVWVDAESMGVESVYYERGFPRYSMSSRRSGESRGRRSYTLSNLPARVILQAVCASLDLGYRVDKNNGEVVFVDKTDPRAQWVGESMPPEQLLPEFRTSSTRQKYVGRTIIVSGQISRLAQGMSELSVNLENRVRLVFPKDSAGSAQIDAIRTKCSEEDRKNREGSRNYTTEVTAMGQINANSDSSLLVLDNCQVLSLAEAYVSRDSDSSSSSSSSFRGGRKIKKLGEGP